MARTGLMTCNEIRALENLPALPGGDELFKPVNTAPIGAEEAARTASNDPTIRAGPSTTRPSEGRLRPSPR